MFPTHRKKVLGKRRKNRLLVEKKYDPECSDELCNMEEEMYQQWERKH